jgi:hypothetical protein
MYCFKPLLLTGNILSLLSYILKTAVERAVFRSGSSLTAVLSSFCYSLETHQGSDTQGCLTLHFAKNVNERRAKSLKPTPPTAEGRFIFLQKQAQKKSAIILLPVTCIC